MTHCFKLYTLLTSTSKRHYYNDRLPVYGPNMTSCTKLEVHDVLRCVSGGPRHSHGFICSPAGGRGLPPAPPPHTHTQGAWLPGRLQSLKFDARYVPPKTLFGPLLARLWGRRWLRAADQPTLDPSAETLFRSSVLAHPVERNWLVYAWRVRWRMVK